MILSISVGIIVLFPEDFINSNDIHLNRAENDMKWIDTDSAKSYLLIRTGNPDRCESAFDKIIDWQTTFIIDLQRPFTGKAFGSKGFYRQSMNRVRAIRNANLAFSVRGF